MLTGIILLTLYVVVAGLSLTPRYGFVLIHAIMIMTVSNDFLLIPIMPELNNIMQYILKGWREIVLFICFISIILHRVGGVIQIQRYIVVLLGVIGFLTVDGFANGLADATISDAIVTWRNYMLPFLLPVSLYVAGFFERTPLRSMAWTLMILSAVMAVYSLYATLTFNGDPKSVWFYYFFYDKTVELNVSANLIEYQFLRDGSLRASGFFISSVDYSMFCGIVVCFALAMLLYLSGWRRWLAVLFGAASLLGIQLSHTRIGFVVASLILVVAAILRWARMRYAGWLNAIPVGVLVISLIAVTIFPDLFDASAAGRPEQYISAWTSFRPLGHGFIAPNVNGPTYKDSLYLSTAGTFGFGMILYIGLFAYLQRALLGMLKASTLPDQDFVVLVAIYFSLMSLWYVFGVHYTIGGFTESILLLLVFAGLYNAREHELLRIRYAPSEVGPRSEGFTA